MIYTLTGFMGSGKSTVGKILRDRTGCPFIDLDKLVEKMQGRSIPDIFRTSGEKAFRMAELDALMEAVSSYEEGTLIISLGGGTLMTPQCRELVTTCSHCIYLRASAETLENALSASSGDRPMLSSGQSLGERIRTLLEERGPVYEKTARYIIDTDGRSYEDITEQILTQIISSLSRKSFSLN